MRSWWWVEVPPETCSTVWTCWFHSMVTLPPWPVSTDFGTCSYQCFLFIIIIIIIITLFFPSVKLHNFYCRQSVVVRLNSAEPVQSVAKYVSSSWDVCRGLHPATCNRWSRTNGIQHNNCDGLGLTTAVGWAPHLMGGTELLLFRVPYRAVVSCVIVRVRQWGEFDIALEWPRRVSFAKNCVQRS